MAYKLAVFFEIWGDFERLYCISIYYASALSLHMEFTDSMISVAPYLMLYRMGELEGHNSLVSVLPLD